MNFLLTVISGLLAALAFPFSYKGILITNLAPLAWVSISLFYIVLKKESSRIYLIYSLTFSLVFFGLVTYPGFAALYETGELDFWPYLINFFITISLFSIIFCIFIWIAIRATSRNIPLWLTLPLAWIAFDLFRHYFPFGGIPWAGLAYSQSRFLTLIQILDITGIYGITFLLIFGNCLVGEFFLFLGKRNRFPKSLFLVFVVLTASTIIYGKYKLNQFNRLLNPPVEELNVAIIQMNLLPKISWDQDTMEKITEKYLFMSHSLESNAPDLIIWPETPQPIGVPNDTKNISAFSSLKTPLILGLMSYEGPKPAHWPPKPDDIEGGFKLFNTAALVLPGGEISDFYFKNHLAPFGEYAPLGTGFIMDGNLVMAATDYSPGKELNLLYLKKVKQDPIPIGVTICFEDLFPRISRTLTQMGAELLINLTNVGWFGQSSVVYQHLAYSRFRAVENRRTLIRSTNTGISAYILPTGEIIYSTPINESGMALKKIPLLKQRTFFTRFGNTVVILFICLFALFFSYNSMRRSKTPTQALE